jgi:hypothetical protein
MEHGATQPVNRPMVRSDLLCQRIQCFFRAHAEPAEQDLVAAALGIGRGEQRP